MSKDFDAFLASCGIKHQFIVPYTPQKNGVLERKNRFLMEMARCMVKSQLLPNCFWLEVVMCGAYILNRCPTKALQSITPYMRLGMARSHLLVTCVYLVVWPML